VTKTNKIILILLASSLGIIATTLISPIAQDPAYHNFTDKRTLYGISNFWNVVSNVPFVLFGLLGLYKTSRTLPEGNLKKLQRAYALFFAGAILVGFGSSYYHLNPSIDTLLWDRLPMTIAFMALFSIIISEYISLITGRLLLIPLLAVGVSSVLYWFYTEQLGAGDLRPYALVQFLPMVLIPVILILFKTTDTHSKYIWALLLVYFFSKISEHFDVYIFNLSGEISGHTIKHLLASLGILFFYLHFNKRMSIADE
jgi:hypothetical protein